MNQFTLIFNKEAQLLEAVNLPAKVQKKELPEVEKDFFHSLTEGDGKRFRSFCAALPNFQSVAGCTAVIKLYSFYHLAYAFAEKNLVGGESRIFVYPFRNGKQFCEYTSPVYLRFLPNMTSNEFTEKNDTQLSPAGILLRDHHEGYTIDPKDSSDLRGLTEQILTLLSTDPAFYGNEITLFSGGDSVFARFSTTAYVHVLYALLAVGMALTRTHRITLALAKDGAGGLLTLCTENGKTGMEALSGVTDLTALSGLTKDCEIMLALAEYISVKQGFRPEIRYSPESREIEIALHIAVDDPLESNFRFREAYSQLAVCVQTTAEFFRQLRTAEQFNSPTAGE